MQLFQLAEMYSNEQRYLAHIKILVEEEEKQIVTAVPKTRGHFLFFHPEEVLTISYIDSSMIHSYQVRFQEIKLIQQKPYYVFTILSSAHVSNVRKEIRKPSEFQGIAQEENDTSLITVLDVSENGMKIESNKPLNDSYLHVLFEKNNSGISCNGKIVWSKHHGKQFLYGLKTYNTKLLP